jgi:hypothetical protein
MDQIYKNLLVISKIDSKAIEDYILENSKPCQILLPDMETLIAKGRTTANGMKRIDETVDLLG